MRHVRVVQGDCGSAVRCKKVVEQLIQESRCQKQPHPETLRANKVEQNNNAKANGWIPEPGGP